MLRNHKFQGLIITGAVLAAVSGTVLAQSTPAKADPQPTLVAVGSDTIQDVWNGFTNGSPNGGAGFPAIAPPLAPNLVASYNATNPATGAFHEAITPTDGWAVQNGIVPNPTATFPLAPGTCSFARPNGSGEGRASLRLALNAASTHASNAVAPVAGLGCVDIARASSGVDVVDNNAAVDIQWVPFAIDAVTISTGPSSCTPATNCPGFTADLGNGTTMNVTTVASTLPTAIGAMTQAQLSSLYNCNAVPVTVGATTTTFIGTVPGTSVPAGDVGVDLYVPQAGSGTRSFWEGTTGVNFPDSTVDTATGCVHDFIIGGVLQKTATQTVQVPVEEHDGTAVSTDPIGLGPFSIAQFISQQNPAHNPRFHGAVLQDINNQSPFGDGTAGQTVANGLNETTFPILRDVYDVVKLSRLTTAGDPIDTLFNGIGSTICKQHGLIQAYGFGLMGTTVFNDLPCGTIQANQEGAP
jgi:hypothetical protein